MTNPFDEYLPKPLQDSVMEVTDQLLSGSLVKQMRAVTACEAGANPGAIPADRLQAVCEQVIQKANEAKGTLNERVGDILTNAKSDDTAVSADALKDLKGLLCRGANTYAPLDVNAVREAVSVAVDARQGDLIEGQLPAPDFSLSDAIKGKACPQR